MGRIYGEKKKKWHLKIPLEINFTAPIRVGYKFQRSKNLMSPIQGVLWSQNSIFTTIRPLDPNLASEEEVQKQEILQISEIFGSLYEVSAVLVKCVILAFRPKLGPIMGY